MDITDIYMMYYWYIHVIYITYTMYMYIPWHFFPEIDGVPYWMGNNRRTQPLNEGLTRKNWKGLEDCGGGQIVTGIHYQSASTTWIWMFPTLIVYLGYQNQPHRVDLTHCQMCHEREARLVDGSHEILKKRWFMLYQHVYRVYVHEYTWYIHGIYHVYHIHM